MNITFASPTFWRYLRYARPYWAMILISILCGILKFTLALFLPYAMGFVTDNVILPEVAPEEKLRRLTGVIALLLLCYLVRVPISYYRSFYAELAGNRTIFDIRSALYTHIQGLSVEYHARQRTGTTTSRLINDVNTTQGILDRGVMSIAVDFIFLSGVVVYLIVADWKLAAVSLFTLPLYGLTFGFINPRLRKVARRVQAQMGEMSGEVSEKIVGQAVVVAFNRERTERLRFFRLHRKYFDFVMDRVRLNVFLNNMGDFLTMLGPVIVICYGSYRVIHNELPLGELLIFNGFLAHLYLPTRRLADASAALQEQLAAMERVFEILDIAPDIRDAPGASAIGPLRGEVRFENVSFHYAVGQPVLRGITLAVAPGQKVAFVGRSGAGKSTLLKLVPRFYDVSSGAVRVDGHDVREITIDSLRSQIAVVMQDAILFNGTIRENILYGRRGASESEMLEAARMAHVHEFVAETPLGYETIIGERGITLSGGQKQRVSIARAFLRNPRILILDEATSNLDSHSEAIIQEALQGLMRGRTTLIIAHRLSTVADSDVVIVMEEGEIIQRGRHEELFNAPGAYHDLCEEQFSSLTN